jgi:hypothetical protein
LKFPALQLQIHSEKVVHRDIALRNLLLDDAGKGKLHLHAQIARLAPLHGSLPS